MKNKILPFLLALIVMLTGCRNGSESYGSVFSGTEFSDPNGTLKIFVRHDFKSSLNRFAATLRLEHPNFTVELTDNPYDSDIVISDTVPSGDENALVPLDDIVADYTEIFPSDFLLENQKGIIGVPLFLSFDAFWFDELIYRRTEADIPASIDELISSSLIDSYIPICSDTSLSGIFWSAVAPVYLSSGGKADDVANGKFAREPAVSAFERLNLIRENALLTQTEDSEQLFTKNSSLFWAENISKVERIQNNMPGLSTTSFHPSLIFHENETPSVVLRAHILTVRESADMYLAEIFIKELYSESTLLTVATESKIPLACKCSYGSHSLPQFAHTVYSVLASPSVGLYNIICRWSDSDKSRIYGSVLAFFNDNLSPEAAADILCGEQ